MKRSLPVKKVLISLLISLALVVCVVPTSAFAKDYELPNSATERSSSAELFATDKTSENLPEDKDSNPSSPSALSLSSQNAIPMVGSVASGINTALYIAEGDYSNAALSAVSMVPGVGTAVKGSALAVKATGAVLKVGSGLLKAAPKAMPVVLANTKRIAGAISNLGSKLEKKFNRATNSSRMAITKKYFNVKPTTEIYRAVGVREYTSVRQTAEFSIGSNSLEVKEFASTAEEALRYADTDPAKVAVLEVKVPTSTLNDVGRSITVDPLVFDSEITYVAQESLEVFNDSIIRIREVY